MVLKIILIALLYYPLSIGLTFYQKWFIKNYKLPLFVVCWHYIVKYFAAILIRFLYETFHKKRIRLHFKEQLRWLAPIGICASLDIGLSNWALEYVTVSLYTMAKSSSILFIVAFSLLLRLERWRPALGLEAALIAIGLFLFTWHSSQLDLTGLLLVELAASCTGVRWTVSQLVMQREEQALNHPLDMVAHVQPWMLIPIVPLIITFEGSELSYENILYFNGQYAPVQIAVLVACGGLLAFCMEMSEYLLLVNTSGITLNIFGILKEVATLLLAHLLNNDRLSSVNIAGLVLCLLGMALHGMSRKRQRSRPGSPKDDSRKLLLVDDTDG
uniref:TPT domain-containing protein n=1 Tax=Haemonchus contortus TaxID=6289 RepID=A0A7I4XX10_HAECO